MNKFYFRPLIKSTRKKGFLRRLLIIAFMLFFSGISYADNAQMKETLVKIINQLQAIKPLINEAERQQVKNPRIQVHFDKWVDENGQKHRGLRQDIEAIQNSLIQIVDRETIEPRVYSSIKNDFMGKP